MQPGLAKCHKDYFSCQVKNHARGLAPPNKKRASGGWYPQGCAKWSHVSRFPKDTRSPAASKNLFTPAASKNIFNPVYILSWANGLHDRE